MVLPATRGLETCADHHLCSGGEGFSRSVCRCIAFIDAKMCTFQDQQISECNLNMGAFNSGKYKDLGGPIWAQIRRVNGWGTFSASFCRNWPNCRRKADIQVEDGPFLLCRNLFVFCMCTQKLKGAHGVNIEKPLGIPNLFLRITSGTFRGMFYCVCAWTRQ